jgi:hypothetical protein
VGDGRLQGVEWLGPGGTPDTPSKTNPLCETF